MHGLEVKKATTETELQDAIRLEGGVFQQCGFVDTQEYEVYIPQSHFFGGFDGKGCGGMVRLITGAPLLPPVLSLGLVIEETPEKWRSLASTLKLDEFATIAVEESRRGLDLFLDLVRVSYRDAKERGVTHFGIIMEKERVEALNSFYKFRYRQVGPEQHYQGEVHLVAPFILDFKDQEDYLLKEDPDYLDWFINEPINSGKARPQ